jgi:glycosyltransferase involved in cell wall biosynthesis
VGWPTVLGQIDPGPEEERIVASLRRSEPWGAGHWEPAPAAYWERWRAECTLAGSIMVNSEFSRRALITEGVAAEKICVVPLVLASPAGAEEFVRQYPASFSARRPLRVLFLGQAGLRKGIHLVMRAAELLKGDPVEIHVVGPVQVERSEAMQQHPVLRWHGAVPRSAVAAQYQNADVFLFPTFSDGFGLTQLEAQAWKLPVLASRFCGDVVRDGENGLLIDPLTAEMIAQLLLGLLREPARLRRLSAGSRLAAHQMIEGLAQRLQQAQYVGSSRC